MNPTSPPPPLKPESASFAETALRLGGKSEEEARRTGALDKADDQVETLFATHFQTAQSPIHRAVWERKLPVELFGSATSPLPVDVAKVMDDSLAIARKHRDTHTLLDDQGKLSPAVRSRAPRVRAATTIPSPGSICAAWVQKKI